MLSPAMLARYEDMTAEGMLVLRLTPQPPRWGHTGGGPARVEPGGVPGARPLQSGQPQQRRQAHPRTGSW